KRWKLRASAIYSACNKHLLELEGYAVTTTRNRGISALPMGIDLQQQLLARHMLLSGYVTHIVQIETGLPPKKVRHIMKCLLDEGYRDEKRSRAVRTSKTLIYNHITKLHASLLMQIYHRYGGDLV